VHISFSTYIPWLQFASKILCFSFSYVGRSGPRYISLEGDHNSYQGKAATTNSNNTRVVCTYLALLVVARLILLEIGVCG
jgi:hypothetical protein